MDGDKKRSNTRQRGNLFVGETNAYAAFFDGVRERGGLQGEGRGGEWDREWRTRGNHLNYGYWLLQQ